jgi:pterin-4a-carbinolamine dehydratase
VAHVAVNRVASHGPPATNGCDAMENSTRRGWSIVEVSSLRPHWDQEAIFLAPRLLSGRCWTLRRASSENSSLRNYGESFAFVTKAAELAEAEAHHPDISFGWGYATVSLRTKMIKGLHENDFIMAAKLDRLVNTGVPSRNGT